MDERVRAGIIGDTGHLDGAGEYVAFENSHDLHLPFQHLPGVEVVAVADATEFGRAMGLAQAGALRAYSSFAEMLKSENLNVVAICSRHAELHEAQIMAAIEAGCHVLVDKPFTPDVATADRLIAAAERRGVQIAVAHQSRYLEPFATALRLVAEGEIGTLLSMHGRVKEDRRGGMEDVMCCGVHITDLMRMFAGDPAWVFGSITVDGRPIAPDDAYVAEDRNGLVAGDSVTAVYGFSNGVMGHLVTQRDLHRWSERWGLTLHGTAGVLSLRMFNDFANPSRLRISKARVAPEEAGPFEDIAVPSEPVVPGSASIASNYPPLRGNRLAAWDLLTAAKAGHAPKASGKDGRWSIEMAHGIYLSHFSGRRIPFPLVDREHPLGPKA